MIRIKQSANFRKNKVSFAKVASVFLDPLALIFSNPDHSGEENRGIAIGLSSNRASVVRFTL